MPIDTLPVRGEPAKVEGLTILVALTCQLCAQHAQVMVLNGQSSACPSCGAMFTIDVVRWDKDSPMPFVGLSATPVAKTRGLWKPS